MSSNRKLQRGSRTVLDNVSRRRAQQLHLEELQQDNFTETSGISVSGNLDAGVTAAVRRKRGGLEAEEVGEIHASSKKGHKRASIKRILTQKKNLATLVQESDIQSFSPSVPTYLTCIAAPSRKPPRKFCSVCGYFSSYSCEQCGMLYCCIKCRGA
ncbi:hypothetical protein DFJ77DRAFT_154716 [Powellomyces hirtus]|nr:hypothetical protein DFJ77DRAFT_154716 [Powellomyces hirtus]